MKRVPLALDLLVCMLCIEHFKREGDGYQSRINAVLKAHVPAQRMEDAE